MGRQDAGAPRCRRSQRQFGSADTMSRCDSISPMVLMYESHFVYWGRMSSQCRTVPHRSVLSRVIRLAQTEKNDGCRAAVSGSERGERRPHSGGRRRKQGRCSSGVGPHRDPGRRSRCGQRISPIRTQVDRVAPATSPSERRARHREHIVNQCRSRGSRGRGSVNTARGASIP